MYRRLQAVYEKGVLRPLEPLSLEEHQQVTVTVTNDDMTDLEHVKGYFTPEEWEEALHDDITIEEVWKATSSIPGSLSEAIIALRQEQSD